MNYKPGDPVWVKISPGHAYLPSPAVLPAVIIGPAPKHVANGLCVFFPDQPPPHYSLSIVDYSGPLKNDWSSSHVNITPRHMPYEGDQVGSWDTCPYRPEHAIV